MKKKQTSMDMLHGSLWDKIILFALPIALSSILQQLFNAADTSVVGNFADSTALAAVGTNGEIVALLVTIANGLSMGANVLIAKYIGEGRREKISQAIHTNMVLSLIFGFSIAILGELISAWLLTIIKTPAAALPGAILYLRLYFLGYPFLMVYNYVSAILRAKGDSRRPFYALTFSGLINVGLNLFFVIVCKLGVAGVAIATDLSTAVSALLVLYWLFRETEEFHLSLKKLHLDPGLAAISLKIGVPAAIQLAVFSLANIFIQASVNSFGEIETAGATISMNFEYFGYYMVTAFAQAATTFASQNFAAGNRKRCNQIMVQTALLSILFSAMITLPLTIWRDFFSGLFSPEKEVIAAAAFRILIVLTIEPLCSLFEIPAGVLRGIGHSTLPAFITVVGICFVRILWVLTVFPGHHSQAWLYIIFPATWCITNLATWIATYLCYVKKERMLEKSR